MKDAISFSITNSQGESVFLIWFNIAGWWRKAIVGAGVVAAVLILSYS